MALTLANDPRSAMADALVGSLDAGSGAGKLEIRSGTRPATPHDTATGSVLATVTLIDPAFGDALNGVTTLADPGAVTADATGTATWFRALDSDNNPVMDGAVSATGGGGDLTLATTSMSAGLSVDITGGTVTVPAS